MPPIKTPIISGGPQIRSAVLHSWNGGLNFRDDDLQIAPNETADCLDVDLVPMGGFTRRDSFRSLGSTTLDSTLQPKLLFQWPNDGDNGTIVVGGTKSGHDYLAVYDTASVSEAHAPLAERQFTTDSTLGQTWSCALMSRVEAHEQNLFIHRDYLSPVQSFQADLLLHSELTNAYGHYNDNFANPIGGTMPYASIMCAHLEYMFHADCYENSIRREARIRWSHPGHPGDYRTNDYIDVGEGQDNDAITALASAWGALFIFKERSVWMLTGYSAETFALNRIAEGVGCSNKNAAAALPGGMGLFFFDRFLGMHEVVAHRVGGHRVWIAQPVWPKMFKAISDGRITGTDTATVAAYGTRVAVSGLFWKGATNPNRTYVYDSIVGEGWWAYSVGFRLIRAFTAPNGAKRLMGASPFTNEGGASATYKDCVCIQTYLNSSALPDKFLATVSNYTGHMQTAWVTGGDPSLKKRFRRFSMVFGNIPNTSPFTVNAYRNWSDQSPRTYTVAGTGAPSGGTFGQDVNVRSGTIGSAYATSLLITGPNDQAWSVQMLTLRFVPMRIV